MNIARVLAGFGCLLLFTACATQHAEETAAPVASPSNGNVTPAPGLAPESEQAPAAAPAAPQGLDQRKSQASSEDQELTTLADAERALNQAKADLDRLALAEPALGHSTADRAEKKDAKRGAPSAAGAPAPAPSAPNALCENACRAFASLTRAASAVCRLDGEGGNHSNHARHVVSDSERRIASCTCPAPGQ
jgi:hypothetical protein